MRGPAIGLTGGDPLVELFSQGIIALAQGKPFTPLCQRMGKWHKERIGVAQRFLFRFG